MADHTIVSEEVVQTWQSRDGHTTSLVRFAEDTDAGVQMGYQVRCSLCGWLPAGGNESERDAVAGDAEYHIDGHNGE
jgi:hypothetical protein